MTERNARTARCALLLPSAFLTLSLLSHAPANAQDMPCPDEALVSQPATPPTGSWKAFVSEMFSLISIGEYYQVSDEIGTVRWWGLLVPQEGAGEPDVNTKLFRITFFAPEGDHLPGLVEQSYEFVLTPAATGLSYEGLPLWSFTAELDPPCALDKGWIVIEGMEGNPGNLFHWISSDHGDGFFARNGPFNFWEFVEDSDLALCLASVEWPEDINDDGVVDLLDLLLVLSEWGPAPPPCPPHPPADVNMDCTVDALDMLAVLAAWGPVS